MHGCVLIPSAARAPRPVIPIQLPEFKIHPNEAHAIAEMVRCLDPAAEPGDFFLRFQVPLTRYVDLLTAGRWHEPAGPNVIRET
jgi:hypothetical protein